MRRVLILGASGFLGYRLALRLRAAHRVFGTFRKRAPRIDGVTLLPFELTADAPYEALFGITRPDVVLYCTRFVEPSDPSLHLFFRDKLPVRLAEILDRRGAEFVFFSDARVFSGTEGPYSEAQEPDGDGELAKIWRTGEESLLAQPNVRIFRLGTLMGMGREPAPSDAAQTYCSAGRVADALEAVWRTQSAPKLLHLGTDDTLGGPTADRRGALDCRLGRESLGLGPLTIQGWAEAYRQGLRSGNFEA